MMIELNPELIATWNQVTDEYEEAFRHHNAVKGEPARAMREGAPMAPARRLAEDANADRLRKRGQVREVEQQILEEVLRYLRANKEGN